MQRASNRISAIGLPGTLFHVFAAIALCLTLLGCKATGADFKPTAATGGKGVIHVYRADTSVLGSEAPTVSIDGKRIGTLKEAGYLSAAVPAGKHVVEVRTPLVQWFGGRKATVNVKPGSKHYFLVEAKFDSAYYSPSGPGVTSSFHINKVPNKTGRAQIARTKASN